MTQVDRVLAALARAGAHGITRVDFQAPNVCDGGEPILNFPARIYDLHQAGIATVVVGDRDACSIYVLASKLRAPASEAKETPDGKQADPVSASSTEDVRSEPAPADRLFGGYVDCGYINWDTSPWKAA